MMTDINPDFVTMGDNHFSNTISASAAMVDKLYPGSTLFVYDWGLSEQTKRDLDRTESAEIVDWRAEATYAPPPLTRVRTAVEERLKQNKYAYHLLTHVLGVGLSALDKRKDFYMRQKPAVIRDCASRTDEPLVFLDGDATLVNRIDELFERPFDIGVTLRSKVEVAVAQTLSRPFVLNAGVIVFNTDTDGTVAQFIDRWETEIESLPEFGLREQSALTELLKRADESICGDYYRNGTLELADRDVTVEVLPCEMYNYFWVESGFDRDRNKILHFKAGEHDEQPFVDIIDDIREGSIHEWAQAVDYKADRESVAASVEQTGSCRSDSETSS